jgi:uncharacterized membrane protein
MNPKGGAVSSDPPGRFVHHGAFGNDRFGVTAERFARFFGTPRFIIGQTVLVVLWITVNTAAYAAPLILLAQTRQADRDKLRDAAIQEHHDADIQRERAFEGPPDRSAATRTSAG